MSYDVSIGPHNFNMTFNVSRIWYDHMDGGLRALDGKTGAQALAMLSDFFDRIEASRHAHWRTADVGEPLLCARYDAPNGWGSTVGALIFTAQVMAACAKHPRLRVRVDA